jgi:hypothetical protein
MTRSRTVHHAAAQRLGAVISAGCGGSSSGSGPAPSFAVVVRVTGLGDSSLVLHLRPASPGQGVDPSITRGNAESGHDSWWYAG